MVATSFLRNILFKYFIVFFVSSLFYLLKNEERRLVIFRADKPSSKKASRKENQVRSATILS